METKAKSTKEKTTNIKRFSLFASVLLGVNGPQANVMYEDEGLFHCKCIE